MNLSAFVFKSEQTVAAISITGLGAKSCGVYRPISLKKIAVLSSMYTSLNQMMIGLSEVPSNWIKLSRLGVPDFPSSLAALVDPPTSPPMQVPILGGELIKNEIKKNAEFIFCWNHLM